MLAAALFVATLADWVPARWPTNDPASLELLHGTGVNCLLVEKQHWSSAFADKAAEQKVAVLGVVRPGAEAVQAVRTAREQRLTGVVLEGEFARAEADAARKEAGDLAVVELPARRGLRFDAGDAITGTYQGVWPGVRPVDEKDKAHAMPTGGPWIDTNTGFLRFARAMRKGEFWIAVTPPEKQVIPVDRYFMAIGDAWMVGARWVLALDGDLWKRLQAREETAVRDWKRIVQHARFYEEQRRYRDLPIYGLMAVVQDAGSGALLSGSILDMIAVKHTPVRPVPGPRLSKESLAKALMAVNIDPRGLSAEQGEVLKEFSRSGGTVLNGPPEWKMPSDSKNHVTVDEEDVKKLDEIWKEMNGMIARGRNMGVRLFNVSSMLSFYQGVPGGDRAVLHLVNYSGYNVENVTAHVLGRYKKATLHLPEGKAVAMEPYDVDEGEATGLDLANVPAYAVVVMEK
ncbi:MAG: hypothetical protein JNK48_05610 [Bryobacterales bacterium]|nr:hypothetical protein [Bryobacterales bacterium]